MNQFHVSLFFSEGRLATFNGHEKLFPDVQSLANAGFILENTGTKCVFCKGFFDSWELDDIPLLEHARRFPTCQFVRFKMGGNVSIYELEEVFKSPPNYHHHSGPEKLINRILAARKQKGYDTVDQELDNTFKMPSSFHHPPRPESC